MDIHKLLQRQLERLELETTSPPKVLQKWQALLNYVSKTYTEADQERYLLERSMGISSREHMDINTQLEDAQLLAGLCHWRFNPKDGIMTWSKSVYELLKINRLASVPSYEAFKKMVHPEDRSHLEKSINQQADDDFELRIKTHKNSYSWFRLVIKNKGDGQLSGILMDISGPKQAEVQIKELNKALVNTARLAGMSEVATIVLHNIGNLLNSINVSLAILKNNFEAVHHKKLERLLDLAQDNSGRLHKFLLHDEKGKLMLPYFCALSETLTQENKSNQEELGLLEKNLKHIKEIVAMQQPISGISGIAEKIAVSDLLQNALEMANLHKNEIGVRLDIPKQASYLVSDKTKLLQIITNLLRNAKQAVMANTDIPLKEIVILVQKKDDEVKIKVKDNGVGVASENLNRIFSFGFTTKAKGHGFGLHSSALSAKELGGSLNVSSEGIGKGAEFILILPSTNAKEVSHD